MTSTSTWTETTPIPAWSPRFRSRPGRIPRASSVTDARGANFRGEFQQAVGGGRGNYLKFSGIGATGFTLTATPGSTSDDVKRAAINGIQIVPAR
jgi:hypothetical protein